MWRLPTSFSAPWRPPAQSPEAINAAEAAIKAMKNGDAIFVGPIMDNTGTQVLPPGTTSGPYADELQRTNYLIDGVIGSLTPDALR